MPNTGLIFAADRYVLRVASSGQGSHEGDGVPRYQHSALGVTRWAPNDEEVLEGFHLSVGGSSLTGEWTVGYTGPGHPLGITWSGSGWTSCEAELVIEDLRVHASAAGLVTAGTLKIYAQEDLKDTIVFAQGGTFFAPASIPLIGIPWTVSASTQVSVSDYDTGEEYEFCADCAGQAAGGWTFRELGGGEDIALPVTLAPGGYAPMPGGCEGPGAPGIEVSTTGDLQISTTAEVCAAYGEHSSGAITACRTICRCDGEVVYQDTVTQVPPSAWTMDARSMHERTQGATVCLLPDLPKALVRLNPDFAALIYRHGFPEVKSSAQSSCAEAPSPAGPDVTVVAETVYAAQDVLLDVMRNEESPLEDVMPLPSYAPWSIGGQRSERRNYMVYAEPVACGATPIIPCGGEEGTAECTHVLTGVWEDQEDVARTGSQSFGFPGNVGSVSGYLAHDAALVRYINTWPNPHWSLWLWTDNWNLQGEDVDWTDYWGPIRSQWLQHPSFEFPQTRNVLVSEPLEESALSAVQDALIGGGRWLGVSRFAVREAAVPESVDYDAASEPLWTVTGGTPAFGGSIVVEPDAEAATIRLDLELGSWTVPPYQFAHWCDRVMLDWEPGNVAEVRVEFVSIGSEDDAAQVPMLEPGVPFRRPLSVSESRYAGSWAIENGFDQVVDKGLDVEAEGISEATMVDGERASALQLLAGRGSARLRIEIDVASDAEPVTLHYPRFYASPDYALVWETGQCGVLVAPEGPGLRFGSQRYWDSEEEEEVFPPDTKGLGWKWTTLDALRWSKNFLEARAHDADESADLAALYDAVEGQSIDDAATGTIAFALPRSEGDPVIRFALANTPAEIPPLAALPARRLDQETGLRGGGWGQAAHMIIQEPRFYVHPRRMMHLRSPDNVILTTADLPPADGWTKTRFNQAVDNDEPLLDEIIVGTINLAQVRRWHGFFAASRIRMNATAISCDVGPDLRHFRAFVVDGSIWAGWEPNALPGWTDFPTEMQADSLCLRVRRQEASLILIYAWEGAVYRAASTTRGETWTMPETLATGTLAHPAHIQARDGREFIYWITDTGDVNGLIRDRAGNTLRTVTGAVTGVDLEGLTLDESTAASGAHRLRLGVIKDGDVMFYQSTDGVNWS